MPSKKRPLSQAKTLRAQRAKLADLGLLKVKDARKKVTRYQEKVIAKYGDVLAGRASVVEVPSLNIARKFKYKFKTKGGLVIVPRDRGERFVYSKKTGEIIAHKRDAGRKITIRHEPVDRLAATMERRLGRDEWIILPTGTGNYPFKTWRELDEFMARDSVHNAQKWRQHAYVEQVDEAA